MKPAPSLTLLNVIFLIQMGCDTATKLAPQAGIVVEAPNVDVVATLSSTEAAKHRHRKTRLQSTLYPQKLDDVDDRSCFDSFLWRRVSVERIRDGK